MTISLQTKSKCKYWDKLRVGFVVIEETFFIAKYEDQAKTQNNQLLTLGYFGFCVENVNQKLPSTFTLTLQWN